MDGPEAGTGDKIDTYDKARRLNSITRNSITQATYAYNALGQRSRETLGNNSYVTYTYAATTNWLTGVYNNNSSGVCLSSFEYAHDKTGQRKKLTYANGDVVNYAYDNAYHLTAETKRDINSNVLYTNAWTYDDVGNRLTAWNGSITTTYSYNTANQLVNTVENAITTTYYTFDANGNQIRKGDGSSITYTWTYNYENLQIAYDVPATTTYDATYKYDATGRRIERAFTNTNGSLITQKSVYDGANAIADYNASDVPSAQYVTPFLDQNLIISKSNNTYYYMQDGLGSVVNLLDSNQAIKNTYVYDAFGESISVTQQVQQNYRFAGRQYDGETGTYYNRYRNDDPRLGRFISADPMGYYAGINLYSYCDDNPVNYTDMWGLFSSQLLCHNGWVSFLRDADINKGGITESLITLDNVPKIKTSNDKGKPEKHVSSSGETATIDTHLFESWYDPSPRFKLTLNKYVKIKGDPKTSHPSDGQVDDRLERVINTHENEHIYSIVQIAAKFYEALESHMAKYVASADTPVGAEKNLSDHFTAARKETGDKYKQVKDLLNAPGELWDRLYSYGIDPDGPDAFRRIDDFYYINTQIINEIRLNDSNGNFTFILPTWVTEENGIYKKLFDKHLEDTMKK